MIKRIAATSFTIALLLGSTSIVNSKEVKEKEEAKKTETVKIEQARGCYVQTSEIIAYLEGFGYTNITITSLPGQGCNVIAETDYAYATYVFVSSTAIVGHEDDGDM